MIVLLTYVHLNGRDVGYAHILPGWIPEYLNIPETAEFLGVSQTSVKRWMR